MRIRGAVGRWVLIGVAAAALAAAAGCSALRGRSGECQQRVVEKIEADHPQSRGATIESNSVVAREQGGNRTLISGRGRVRTRKGDYRFFTFSCVYNELSGRVSDVTYQVQ